MWTHIYLGILLIVFILFIIWSIFSYYYSYISEDNYQNNFKKYTLYAIVLVIVGFIFTIALFSSIDKQNSTIPETIVSGTVLSPPAIKQKSCMKFRCRPITLTTQ